LLDIKRANHSLGRYKALNKINKALGLFRPYVRIVALDISPHALNKHDVSLEKAQEFIDTAKAMLVQNEGSIDERYLYISNDGNAVVIVNRRLVATAYKAEEFDDSVILLFEIVRRFTI
jgi:hypothetical protein